MGCGTPSAKRLQRVDHAPGRQHHIKNQVDFRLEPLVSNVMQLDELNEAIGMLGSDNGQRMKIILEHA